MNTPIRLYGFSATEELRQLAGYDNQTIAEALTVSLTANARRLRLDGHAGWSAFINVASVSGAASVLRIGYSNLPDPDPEDDAHWVDSGLTTVDLTATGASIRTATAPYMWVRFKPECVTSAGSIYLWALVAERQ